MPRRQREEDEDYSVGSGRNQRVCVDNGAADGAAASEEAVLAALEQEASSAQDEAKILEDGAAVVQFLRNQTDEIKQGLLREPGACLGVFRYLTGLSRHYILRLLFVDGPFPMSKVDAWRSYNAISEHAEALAEVAGLGLWTVSEGDASIATVELSPPFKCGLRLALNGGGEPWRGELKREHDKNIPDNAEFYTNANAKWDNILLHMVNMGEGQRGAAALPAKVQRNLEQAGLVITTTAGGKSIGKRGFQFLLMPAREQLWFYIAQYNTLMTSYIERLRYVEGMAPSQVVETLQLIFRIGLSIVGKDYPNEWMTVFQKEKVLSRLCEIGLVYRRVKKSTRYYPTTLAALLTLPEKSTSTSSSLPSSSFGGGGSAAACASASASAQAAVGGHLITETNFKVYAYAPSPVQEALLSKFVDLAAPRGYLLPGLTVGEITRDSVNKIFRRGIVASQLINYLQVNAHERSSGPIPTAVSRQIEVWEQETKRILSEPGTLYKDFDTFEDFEVIEAKAKELEVLVYSSPCYELNGTEIICVKREGHKEIGAFWKARKANRA